MSNMTKESVQCRQWQNLSLAQYVHSRNRVPLGDARSLRNMLHRSFGAAFWRHWNPIWSYGLGKYVYTPLRRLFPAVAAVILTLVISGAIHNLATAAVRGSPAFFFTPWFFLLGTVALLGRASGMNLAQRPWLLRVSVNLTYLVVCLALTLAAKRVLALP